MAKRARLPSLVEIALFEHWKVSAAIAAILLVVDAAVLPILQSSGIPVLKTFGLAAEPVGYILAGAFALIAALNRYVLRRRPRRKYSLAGTGNFRATQAMERTWHAPTIGRTVTSLYDRPDAWTLELLLSLEWKRFQDLCMAYFEEKGHAVECLLLDTEGRTAIKVQQGEAEFFLVQCAAGAEEAVSAAAVKLFCEVLNHRKIAKGFFIAAGEFAEEARAYANTNGITLMTGSMLMLMLQRLPDVAQKRLLALAAAGDYTTPTCPACGVKMLRRKSRRGEFWGCRNFPRCRQKLYPVSVSAQVGA
ncbi:restriction system protein [Novimethylophilus kurashikiensis]|uniref:Restriction system protein n=1 Tax=Novimethylophilus kurashikiensis TaxID=1825523 RepID=A0A2R5FCG5_9PROT|nr:restriction endonuclease [Novimethylophilus kurashikiensis]GBG15248.1 restriction system protein [Novimethylophilus kurashikiensis]